MIKTLFPTQDASLYEASESLNTGNDELLEVMKSVSGSYGALARSRAFIKFDVGPGSALSQSLVDSGIDTSAANGNLKWYLKVFVSEEIDVANEYSMTVNQIRRSWTKGSGRKTHKPITKDGCSWKYRDGETVGTEWGAAGGEFNPGDTPTTVVSQSFNNVQGDISVDVTDMVENWRSTTTAEDGNHGFCLKRSGSQETDSTDYGTQFYFSRNTNTIFPPRLEARYDDAKHDFLSPVTGSEVSMSDMITIQPRIMPEYKQNSVERVFVDTTLKGGARSQAGSVGKAFKQYLPQSSSYAIIDYATGEYIYEHNATASYIGRIDYTQNYFDIDMNGLFPERYYCIEFKIDHYSGSIDVAKKIGTRYHKSDTLFKVVK